MRTFEIFLASSIELKNDREKFRLYISNENDRLHKHGIYLQVVQWEYFIENVSKTRLQDEYNKAIKRCDIAIFLFHTKVGKFSAEEFEIAYNSFKQTNRPQIWTYFKAGFPETIQDQNNLKSVFEFKERLRNMGHFYSNYSNIDNLLLQFKRQLDLIFENENQVANSSSSNRDELLRFIDFDIDVAFNELDNKFLNRNAAYHDLCKEYFAQPNNFSLHSFRSRLKRFVTMNWR